MCRCLFMWREGGGWLRVSLGGGRGGRDGGGVGGEKCLCCSRAASLQAPHNSYVTDQRSLR